jgi:uncharacterized protein (DUF924 family)
MQAEPTKEINAHPLGDGFLQIILRFTFLNRKESLVDMNVKAQDIINFWFHELTPQDWFRKNDQLDLLMRNRFQKIHDCAASGELFHWRHSAEGRLAEILILDQFSRNIYRNTPDAFKYDPMALLLAQEMMILKLDKGMDMSKKKFIYMPLMHSESRIIHDEALIIFQSLGDEETLKFECLHKEIIDRFGRFPHRNKILKRVSTQEEEIFLKDHPGF